MKVKVFSKKKDEEQKIPEIKINIELFLKWYQLVQDNTKEIMLMGLVEREDDFNLTIKELVIPPQTDNSSAFVTTHDEEYSKWLMDMPRDKRKQLRLHFHSHPKMKTNPSGTDESTIADIVENINDYYVRIIGNQDGEFHVDYYNIEKRQIYSEMDLTIVDNKNRIVYLIGKEGFNKKSPIFRTLESMGIKIFKQELIGIKDEEMEKDLNEKIIVTKNVTSGLHQSYLSGYSYGYTRPGGIYGDPKKEEPKHKKKQEVIKDPELAQEIEEMEKRLTKLVDAIDTIEKTISEEKIKTSPALTYKIMNIVRNVVPDDIVEILTDLDKMYNMTAQDILDELKHVYQDEDLEYEWTKASEGVNI